MSLRLIGARHGDVPATALAVLYLESENQRRSARMGWCREFIGVNWRSTKEVAGIECAAIDGSKSEGEGEARKDPRDLVIAVGQRLGSHSYITNSHKL